IAFGQILPRSVLDVPKRGSINVHASLLPRYRGAAPIAWAIMRGETETGITTMQMDEGMDSGAMLLRAPTPIGADETAGELSERLAALGAHVLIATRDGGVLPLEVQPENRRRMTWAEYLRGARLAAGARLS